jgi:hypothetical protein
MELRDGSPAKGTAGAKEFSPRPDPLHKLDILLHLSHCVLGFVTALSRSL